MGLAAGCTPHALTQAPEHALSSPCEAPLSFDSVGQETIGDSLRFRLEIPVIVRLGEPVTMALTAENLTDRPLTLSLGGTNDLAHARFFVERPDGQHVRDSQYGYTISRVLLDVRLERREVRRFS